MPMFGFFLSLVGLANVSLVIGYALFAPPPETVTSRPPVWQCLLAWIVVFVTLAPWAYLVADLGGWMFIWGDNTPPGLRYLLGFAGGVSGAVATAVLARLALGWVKPDYLPILFWLSAGVWGVVAALMLTSDGMLLRLLPFVPILIGIATWAAVYRRQLHERRLSLQSVFALMSVLAVGLAATAYIRS